MMEGTWGFSFQAIERGFEVFSRTTRLKPILGAGTMDERGAPDQHTT